MKKIVVILLMAFVLPLYTVYAQDCSDRIQSAAKLYDQYKKSKDAKYLDAARTLLTNIVKTQSNPEKCRQTAANMLKSFNSSAPASASTTTTSSNSSSSYRSSSSHVVVNQQSSSDYIIGSELIFDPEGGNCSDVRITCRSWFATESESNCDWLSFSENGNNLIIHCDPNPNPEKRSCSIGIICSDETGSSVGEVLVQQKGTKEGSKNRAQLFEESIVKISFEDGKTTPIFENVGSIMKVLDENKNLGMQIDVSLCKNNKSWFKNLFAPMVVNKRIKKITDYFVSSGIDKDRISKNITLVEKGQTCTDCNVAYARVVE